MTGLNDAMIVFTPLLYGCAVFGYAEVHLKNRRMPIRPVVFAIAAWCCHAALLAARWSILGYAPVTTFLDGLSVLAFIMTTTYILVELGMGVATTGLDVMAWPFAMVILALSLGPHRPVPNGRLDNPLFLQHVVPALIGVASIIASGIYGMLYLRLARAIRAKQFGALFHRLPDLQVLARMNFRAAAIGFVFVTMAIGWGATWYGRTIGRVDVSRPEIFLTLLIWTVLILPVVGRWIRRWTDRATAVTAVITMAIVVVFLAVSLLPIGFHG